MMQTVNAVVDEETIALIAELKERLGKSESEIVCERIRLLSATPKPNDKTESKPHRFSGAASFDSGIGDLATNPKHMEGFGED